MRSMAREIEFSGVARRVEFATRIAGVTVTYAAAIAAMFIFHKLEERKAHKNGGP